MWFLKFIFKVEGFERGRGGARGRRCRGRSLFRRGEMNGDYEFECPPSRHAS